MSGVTPTGPGNQPWLGGPPPAQQPAPPPQYGQQPYPPQPYPPQQQQYPPYQAPPPPPPRAGSGVPGWVGWLLAVPFVAGWIYWLVVPTVQTIMLSFQNATLPGRPATSVGGRNYSDLGRLHFDLAGFPLPRQLDALRSLTADDHLHYGSDFPFTPDFAVAAARDRLAEVIDPPDLLARVRANTEQLFPRLAKEHR